MTAKVKPPPQARRPSVPGSQGSVIAMAVPGPRPTVMALIAVAVASGSTE